MAVLPEMRLESQVGGDELGIRVDRRVPLAYAGTLAWRLVGIALMVAFAAYVVAQLRLLVLAFFGAMLITSMLVPPTRWLRSHGVPSGFATALAFLALFGSLALAVTTFAPVVAREFRDLDTVVTEGVDDVKQWLVDGPISIDADDVDAAEDRIASELRDLASGNGLVSGARAVAEGVTGIVLAIALSVFFVHDGTALQQGTLRAFPPEHRARAARAGRAAWQTLGGYVRGLAIIGLVEGTAMAVTLAIVGADLAVPIGLLTFLCAFLPFVGATVAAIVAALVALVSVGPAGALVVAIVALAVQQFDNELLAPLVYGRMTRLHPVVVLTCVAAGAGLAGLGGAVLAVPAVATSVAAVRAARVDPPP